MIDLEQNPNQQKDDYLRVEDYSRNSLYETFPVLNNPILKLKSEQYWLIKYIEENLPKTQIEILPLLFKPKKLSTNYIKKLKKTLCHILFQSYINKGSIVIPKNTRCYAILQHEYLSYRTVSDAIEILVRLNLICRKNGSKKLNPYGYRKEGNYLESPGFMTEITLLGEYTELGKLVFSASGVYREETQLDYEPVKNSEIYITRKKTRTNFLTEKKETITLKTRVSNKKLQEELDLINNATRDWGFHFNNQFIKYKSMFQNNLFSGGRLYSNFQNVKKSERFKITPMNFREADFKSSVLNIAYKSYTGEFYTGEDCYSDILKVLRIEIFNNELEKKLYRKVMKSPILCLFNAEREKCLMSIRRQLSFIGLNYNAVYSKAEKEFNLSKEFFESLLNFTIFKFNDYNPKLDSSGVKKKLCWKIVKETGLLYSEVIHLPIVKELLETIEKQFSLFKSYCKKNKIKRAEVKQYLFRAEDIIQASVETHYKIKSLFFNPKVGLKLVNIEKQVLIHVFKTCIKLNIPVLSIHDAFYTSKKNLQSVLNIMNESLIEVCENISFSFKNFIIKLNTIKNNFKALLLNRIMDDMTPSFIDIRVGGLGLRSLIGLIREEVEKLQSEWDYVAIH